MPEMGQGLYNTPHPSVNLLPQSRVNLPRAPKGWTDGEGVDDPGREVTQGGEEFSTGNHGSVTDKLGDLTQVISSPEPQFPLPQWNHNSSYS